MEILCPDNSTARIASPNVAKRVLESDPIHENEGAAEYDSMVSRHHRLLNRPFIEMLAGLPLDKGRVLDIGTGPGWIPIALAERRPQWEIWGVDPSRDMLRRARGHARASGVTGRVHFIEGNAVELPFDDGHFDIVSSHFVLHHLERPEQMLNEAARVTRGGGRVLIKDLRRQPRWKAACLLAFSKYILRYNEAQLKMYADSLGAALTHNELRAAVANSRLSMAKIRGFRGLDLVVKG